MILGCTRCKKVIVYDYDAGTDIIQIAKLYGWYTVGVNWMCPDCFKTIGVSSNMIIKIGETVEHGGQKFVIVDVKHHATMDGVALVVTAYDPEMANKEQQKQIKMDQTSQNMIDMLKKLTEGGGLDFGGFKIGGQ